MKKKLIITLSLLICVITQTKALEKNYSTPTKDTSIVRYKNMVSIGLGGEYRYLGGLSFTHLFNQKTENEWAYRVSFSPLTYSLPTLYDGFIFEPKIKQWNYVFSASIARIEKRMANKMDFENLIAFMVTTRQLTKVNGTLFFNADYSVYFQLVGLNFNLGNQIQLKLNGGYLANLFTVWGNDIFKGTGSFSGGIGIGYKFNK